MSDLALFDTAPPTSRRGLAAAAKAAALGAASRLLMPAMKAMAPDHIGGETLDDAWRVARRLQCEGYLWTLGFWDTPADQPAAVARTYREAIARVAETSGYVSIKPPALRFDPSACRELAAAAADAGVRLHCDSHGLNVADLTLAFAERLTEHLSPSLVSVSVPGRWGRSPADVARLLDQGLGVRLVKGEWPDPADPARDLRAGFLAVTDAAAWPGARVAAATHDIALLDRALRRLTAAGAHVEAEAIFGLHSDLLAGVAFDACVRARVYVPYGRGFVPSALKALRRHPGLAVDVLRHMVGMRG